MNKLLPSIHEQRGLACTTVTCVADALGDCALQVHGAVIGRHAVQLPRAILPPNDNDC